MIELRSWIASSRFSPGPWLVLGKGPTFARRDEFPLDEYNLMGLNNVVGEQQLDVAHIIDTDVVARVADRLEANCRYLVMPRRPHVSYKATDRLLESFFDELPVLRRLDQAGRLVWYNARTGAPVDRSPVIRVRSFSSEAALDILGEMGVKTVRTLGVDGGRGYAREFDGLPQLGNGLPTYDAQFREIEDIVRDRGMDFDPLVDPVRIYVGTDQTQMVATRVLEHSIREHATVPVRVIPMLDLPTPVPKDEANRGRTGFSFARFHIPRLAGHRGRAIYMDADMQVFGDVKEFNEVPFHGEQKVIVTRQDEPPPAWKDFPGFHPGRQMSVMVLDCERLDWNVERVIGGLDEGRYDYARLLFDLAITPEEEVGDHLAPEWNRLSTAQPGFTKNLHYTVVPTQPWKNEENPLRRLWEEAFHAAQRSGILYPSDVRRAVTAGYVKRSLVGKSPASKPQKAVGRALVKGEQALLKADRRYPALRDPRVARVRSRLGLL